MNPVRINYDAPVTLPEPKPPMPTQNTWAIIRFDIAHLGGVLEGAFIEETVASKLRDALARKATDPESKFNSMSATFILFRRVDDPAG